jgi:hypothetical protein
MIIKMKSLAASPEGVMTAGKEYDIDADAAQALIDGGYAELAGGQEAPIEEVIEEAPIEEKSKKGKK